jgi:hypothetical protein
MSEPVVDPFADGGDESIPTEPAPGEPGHPDTPMPPPSLGWSAGLVDDPFDYSRDDEVVLPEEAN